MKKQTVEFAVTRKGDNIIRIGNTGINQPKTNFKGGYVKFYEDKPKQMNR